MHKSSTPFINRALFWAQTKSWPWYLRTCLSVLLAFVVAVFLLSLHNERENLYKVYYQDLDQSALSSDFLNKLGSIKEIEFLPYPDASLIDRADTNLHPDASLIDRADTNLHPDTSLIDRAELERLLLNGSYDYFLQIPSGFQKQLEAARYASTVNVYRLHNSSSSIWLDEQISLVLLEIWGSAYTKQALQEQGIHIESVSRSRQSQGLVDTRLIDLREYSASDVGFAKDEQGGLALTQLMSLFLFFLLLLNMSRWSRNLQEIKLSGNYQRLMQSGSNSTLYFRTQCSVLLWQSLLLSSIFMTLYFLLERVSSVFPLTRVLFQAHGFGARFINARFLVLSLVSAVIFYFIAEVKQKAFASLLRTFLLALAFLAFAFLA